MKRRGPYRKHAPTTLDVLSGKVPAALPPSHEDQMRAFAVAGALAEIERIRSLFPELRQRVIVIGATSGATMQQLADDTRDEGLKSATLKHWKKTKRAIATNGALRGLGMRDALRKVLSPDRAMTLRELRAAFDAGRYKHSGSSPLNARISQEANKLAAQGEATVTGSHGRRGTRAWQALIPQGGQ